MRHWQSYLTIQKTRTTTSMMKLLSKARATRPILRPYSVQVQARVRRQVDYLLLLCYQLASWIRQTLVGIHVRGRYKTASSVDASSIWANSCTGSATPSRHPKLSLAVSQHSSGRRFILNLAKTCNLAWWPLLRTTRANVVTMPNSCWTLTPCPSLSRRQERYATTKTT